jgi:hypothetical protein
VFNISRLHERKKFELYENGVITLDQIDLTFESFNSNQTLQIESEQTGATIIDRDRIKRFLEELRYPLYFLDFETMATAVPIFDHSRPYQQLVFQYSLHIQDTPNAPVRHVEYLAEADPEIDPRRGFVKQLIKDCGTDGDIIVYNIGFERGKIRDAIEQFPTHRSELENILSRLKDLMIPFQQKWYYTPEMKGSYSIKKELPVLVPKLSYKDQEIQEGGMASLRFTQMVLGTFKGDVEQIKKALLEYCQLDTLAMVKILERLYSII